MQRFTSQDGEWKTNYWWNHNIIHDSHPVFVYHYRGAMRDKILSELLESEVISGNLDDYSCMNYVWTKMSHIPWHDDGHALEGVTVYLNEEWKHDWGGIFLYKKNESDTYIRGAIPKFNSAGKNTGHVLHTVTMVSNLAPPRVTLQLFKIRDTSNGSKT
jgi:Rps23 Pro-64 3,4-dihydroxylase Tpa1-like proline 4-hydroxylase